MTAHRRVRRTLVVSGVLASLLLGVASIRVAADMTAAAAPPPAPPVSLDSLKTALAAEQTRGAALQAELDDLLTVTDQLTAALSSTEGEVKVDGLTAKELKARLKAAEAKLRTVNQLLKEAQRRLTALGVAPVKTPKPASGGGGSGSGTTKATPTPAPAAAAAGFESPCRGGVRGRPRHLDDVFGQRVRQLCPGAVIRFGDPLPAGGHGHARRTDHRSFDDVLPGRGAVRLAVVPAVLPDEDWRRDQDGREDVYRAGQRAMRSVR